MTTTEHASTRSRTNVTGTGASSAAEEIRQQILSDVPVTERRLQLAGILTAVLEGGEGPPIVLLHGPGEYGAKWLGVIPEMVATHRVIAPDLPGHGISVVPDGTIDAERALDWLGELIERTCDSPPVLVGQIISGALAARFAASRGDRIRGLVLADALGLAPFQPAPEFGAALMEFVTNPSGETHDRLWERCAHDLDRLRGRMGETWELIRAYNLDRARDPALKPTQHALMEAFGFPAIPPEELARITVPVVLIWGRHDLATPLAVAEDASVRHGWTLHVIEDAADDPPMEQPVAFVEALRTALDAPSDAGPGQERSVSSARDAWDRIAPGYDAHVTPSHLSLANEGLRLAGFRAGMRFLDVAAGSGALSIPAARLGARVLAVDHAPTMLEALGSHARKEDLRIETRVMDGHALALEDASFDMAGSQFGVMLFLNMPRGIREMARVVRPGGRVLVTAFGNPSEIEFLGFLVRAVQAVRPEFQGPPMDPQPLPFQLANPERMRREFVAAGLSNVQVEQTIERLEFQTGADLWRWLVSSNPIVEEVLGELELTAEERNVVQERLDELVRERADDAGVAVLTSPINIGVGTK